MKHIKSILIADDEPLAVKTLIALLDEAGWNGHLLTAHDGLGALASANQSHPDLIFLDIRMPGISGIDVLRRLTYEPIVVFTTAYEDHAITAFELGAVDYLLKPFGIERFTRLIARLGKTKLQQESALPRALEALSGGNKKSRIFVRDGSKIVPVVISQLERIEAADDYVSLHLKNKQYLVYLRISKFAAAFKGLPFIRIHRSHIVNLEHVVSIEPFDAHRVEVVMSDGTRIVASREGSKVLRGLPI
jgi:two-component system LytT family response regulator